MFTMFFTKDIWDVVLDEAIKLRTSLRSVYLSYSVSKNSDGTVPDDNIKITFSRALISSEQDEITNLINTIDSSYDLWARKVIETQTMSWAESRGREVMRQFSSNNIYRGKTEEQIEQLVTQYPDIIHSLTTGSLKTAYATFLNMSPDANISQEEIDEFVLRLAIILGV